MGALARMEIPPMTAPLPDLAEKTLPDAALAEAESVTSIDTRFGRIAFRKDREITMPVGMLGFGHLRTYGLGDMPDPRFKALKLLQSMQDPDVSFVVMPLEPQQSMITPDDAKEAFRVLSITPAEALIVLVVSPRNDNGQVRFSVNCRAPVIFDTRRLLGWQHVLGNARYQVRQPI
jgi:flagellar assembly factor FliW